jgi:hypothetical protein
MIYKKMRLKKYSQFTEIKEGRSKWDEEGMEDDDREPEISPYIEPFQIFESGDEWGYDCIFKSKSDNSLYFFAGESFLDKDELEQYGTPPRRKESDEGGYVWVTDTRYWNPERWVIEAYVNYNFSHLKYGEGVEDYEAGDSQFILIDEPLRELLKKEIGFSKL